MYNWILVLSLTVLSSCLLISMEMSKIFVIETAAYFHTSVQNVLFRCNVFNIGYVVFGFSIFPSLTKYFVRLVKMGLFLTVGITLVKYVIQHHFSWYVYIVPLQSIAYVLIMAAPYGLLNLFKKEQKVYITSVILFMPTILSNLCILYGKKHIYYSYPIRDITKIHSQINYLNLSLLLVVFKFFFVAYYLMENSLYNQIKDIAKMGYYPKAKGITFVDRYLGRIMREFEKFQYWLLVCLGCWGVIVGVGLAFGNQQMVEIFFGQSTTQKSSQFYTETQLISILIAFILTNFLTSITAKINSNQQSIKLTNYTMVFYLNIIGLLAALFLQSSISLPYEFLHHKIGIILGLVLVKVGMYYSSIYVLAEFSYHSTPMVGGFGLIFIGNITKIYILDQLEFQSDTKLFIYITTLVWLCILLIHQFHDRKHNHIGFKTHTTSSSTKFLSVMEENKYILDI